MRLLDECKLKHNIEEIAKYDMENNNVFGSSYFVFQSERIVFKKHFGNADLCGSKTIDDSTIYRLASMTKPITAVAILILVDKGLISLNDPISKYLPEFEDIHVITADGIDLGKTKSPVTILHCLTHTSGLGSEKNVAMTDYDRTNISNTLSSYIKAGLDFEPFTRQAYSPFAAFDALAAVVESVTNQDYETFLENEIFIPCNMFDTTFSPTESQWNRVVEMHIKTDGHNDIGKTYQDCVFEKFPASHKLAGAGLVSTLNDYASFVQMLLKKGKVDNRSILSEKTFNLLSFPHVPSEIMHGNERWGLGVRVITEQDYSVLPVGAYGWSGAYGSHFWVDPENQICAVYMKNSRFDGGSGNKSAQRFEKAVFDALDCEK